VRERLQRALGDEHLRRILRTSAGQRVLFTALAFRMRQASASGVAARLAFELTDEAAAAGAWTVALDGRGAARARPGTSRDATATLTMEVVDLGRMAAGRLSPGVAVVTGKMDLRGDLSLLLQLGNLLGRN
jgi:alkyl sulfatase BDS1-like metallo-beta-lactamase superfamily hydrolase